MNGDNMKVRYKQLDPRRIYTASFVEAPSFFSRTETRTVLEVNAGAPMQFEPPGAPGLEVVEATAEEWARLREAGYDLPQTAPTEAPMDAIAHHDRGCALIAEGRLQDAIDEFTQAIAMDPNDAGFYYNRGYVYSLYLQRLSWTRVETTDGRQLAMSGDSRLLPILDQAIADYTAAITLDPQRMNALGMRAEMYYMKGLRDLAIADYRRAVALGDEVAKRMLKERFEIDCGSS
jgi:tetratricopeptide (TPR) repeat protein